MDLITVILNILQRSVFVLLEVALTIAVWALIVWVFMRVAIRIYFEERERHMTRMARELEGKSAED